MTTKTQKLNLGMLDTSVEPTRPMVKNTTNPKILDMQASQYYVFVLFCIDNAKRAFTSLCALKSSKNHKKYYATCKSTYIRKF